MSDEIELKLLLPQGIDYSAIDTLIHRLAAQVSASEFTLFNQYFDTPDWQLSHYGIGLRVRSSENGIEQTIKTAGKSIGGLHQRPEYNVPIDQLEPNLDLFDSNIWPDTLSISDVQTNLSQIFNTDFKRHAYVLEFSDEAATKIEVACDSGTISTHDNSTDISEIELEFKQGDTLKLFELAQQLTSIGPTQLCNLSKAARGFLLAKNALAPPRQALVFVAVDNQDTLGDAFCKALGHVLNYWQRAEYLFMQSQKIADLYDVFTGIRLTAQCINLYCDLLQSEELLELDRLLKIKLRKWAWIDQLHSLKILRSKRGAYSKKLNQHDALMSYLRGLQDGTLNLSKPQMLITQSDNTNLQLKLAKLLLSKPWQETSQELRDTAKICLQRAWDEVRQTITSSVMSAEDYLAQDAALRKALYYDLFLGNLFQSQKRDPYRAPWLDILDGITELHTIKVLQTKLHDSDVEDKSDLLAWSETKKNNLLAVIEQSKAVALELEPYW